MTTTGTTEHRRTMPGVTGPAARPPRRPRRHPEPARTTHRRPRAASRSALRPLALVLLALLVGGGVAAGGRALLADDGPVPEVASREAGQPAADEARLADALAALRRWDRARATAYASGRAARLRDLYAPGSTAADADVRILESYAERGLVVDGMRTQVLRVEAVALGDDLVTLRVRDRVVGAEVVDEEGRRLVLPRDGPTTRVVTLVREGDTWLVSAVDQE